MAIGDYPAEYNPSVHGTYDPARFYGKPDTAFGEVKLGEIGSWLARRNKSPRAFVGALSRAYWRWNHKYMLPKRTTAAPFFQVTVAAMVFFYVINYGRIKMDERIDVPAEKLAGAANTELFELSEVGSLYFGGNPDPEAQQLLEQARELLRDDYRIQQEKTIVTEEQANILKKKIYLNSTVKVPSADFEPIAEIKRILNSTRALAEQGGQIDHLKEKLQLDQAELKRRKLLLQKAIRSYELKRLGKLSSALTSD